MSTQTNIPKIISEDKSHRYFVALVYMFSFLRFDFLYDAMRIDLENICCSLALHTQTRIHTHIHTFHCFNPALPSPSPLRSSSITPPHSSPFPISVLTALASLPNPMYFKWLCVQLGRALNVQSRKNLKIEITEAARPPLTVDTMCSALSNFYEQVCGWVVEVLLFGRVEGEWWRGHLRREFSPDSYIYIYI